MIRRVIWDLDNTLMERDLKAEEAFFKKIYQLIRE